MHAHISRPVIKLAPHKVLTDEIIDDIRAHHPTHEKIGSIPRHLIKSGVRSRYFSHPIDSPFVGGDAGIAKRTAQAYADAVDMAEAAARQLLTEQDMAPEKVDVLVTSHSVSGGRLPGIDIPLAERLGLRPNVRRIPLSTVACAGGAITMARAADMLMARPNDTVLGVVSEPLSTTYHHADTDIQSMIFKGLFGDAAAAFLATSTPRGPGVRIEDTLEYRLPRSQQAYFTRPDSEVVHFGSTKISLTAVRACLPELQSWVAGQPTDVPVIHTGSPGIINSVAHALGRDEPAARHAHASLAELGNIGGSAVIDGLLRVHDDPPAPGSSVTVVSFGPGFVMAANRGIWCS
ncbi:PhlD [Streptomyces noursei]|uniref:PhlD n=1 Tax=Streptomyces noursei TaxID=1971 RepID=UPI00331FF5FF